MILFQLDEYKDENQNPDIDRIRNINNTYIDEVICFTQTILVPEFKKLGIPIELSIPYMELALHAERIMLSINSLTTDKCIASAKFNENDKVEAINKLYALNESILDFVKQKNTFFACVKALSPCFTSPKNVPLGIQKIQNQTKSIIELINRTFLDFIYPDLAKELILQSFTTQI